LRGAMFMLRLPRFQARITHFQLCFLPAFFGQDFLQRFLEDYEVANPFAIQTSLENDLSIVALEGFVDAHTAPQFEDAVQKAVNSGSVRIVVDCEKLNYISSAGLGVFMSFIEEVRDRGGDIKICGLTPKVKHTFDILGFQDIFEMLDDQQTALQRFNA